MAVVEFQLGMENVCKLFQELQASTVFQTKVLLFTLPTTITETDDISTLTEATFPGYARQPFTAGTVGFDGTNDRAFWTSAQVTFTYTTPGGPQTIYGWAIVMESGGVIADQVVLGGIFRRHW